MTNYVTQANLLRGMEILINPARARKSGLESLETSVGGGGGGTHGDFDRQACSITGRVLNLGKCYFWTAGN